MSNIIEFPRTTKPETECKRRMRELYGTSDYEPTAEDKAFDAIADKMFEAQAQEIVKRYGEVAGKRYCETANWGAGTHWGDDCIAIATKVYTGYSHEWIETRTDPRAGPLNLKTWWHPRRRLRFG